MSLRFEWNRKKALLNIRKHGIAFEERFITVGTSAKGRILVVVHMDHQDVIRIISARKATRNERNQYELG